MRCRYLVDRALMAGCISGWMTSKPMYACCYNMFACCASVFPKQLHIICVSCNVEDDVMNSVVVYLKT